MKITDLSLLEPYTIEGREVYISSIVVDIGSDVPMRASVRCHRYQFDGVKYTQEYIRNTVLRLLKEEVIKDFTYLLNVESEKL